MVEKAQPYWFNCMILHTNLCHQITNYWLSVKKHTINLKVMKLLFSIDDLLMVFEKLCRTKLGAGGLRRSPGWLDRLYWACAAQRWRNIEMWLCGESSIKPLCVSVFLMTVQKGIDCSLIWNAALIFKKCKVMEIFIKLGLGKSIFCDMRRYCMFLDVV